MRIFTEQVANEYAEKHPESKVALQDWVQNVKKSEWSCFVDIKKTFNSVDNIANNVMYSISKAPISVWLPRLSSRFGLYISDL